MINMELKRDVDRVSTPIQDSFRRCRKPSSSSSSTMVERRRPASFFIFLPLLGGIVLINLVMHQFNSIIGLWGRDNLEFIQVVGAVPHRGRASHLSDQSGPFSSHPSALQTRVGVPNPQAEIFEMYNIPINHRAGVRVDLGISTRIGGKSYSLSGGQCPVYGKYIQPHQKTTDKNIWPNDFTASIPLQGSPQDTKPLGGGFAIPQNPAFPSNDVKDIKESLMLAAENRHDIDPDLVQWIHAAREDWEWCAIKSKGFKSDGDYQYNWVADVVARKCWILYTPQQHLMGGICMMGDEPNPTLGARTWYCFEPKKARDKRFIYGSSRVRLDHEKACPSLPLKDVKFGQWAGDCCIPLAPERVLDASSIEECGEIVFDNSPADNLVNPYPTASGSTLIRDAVRDFFLATQSSDALTHGIGVNFATFDKGGNRCHLHSAIPECVIPAEGHFSITSLGSLKAVDAKAAPCIKGTYVEGACQCPKATKTKRICGENGNEKVEEVPCECAGTTHPEVVEEEGSNPWLWAGPLIGVAVLALAGGGAFVLLRKKKQQDPKLSVAEASGNLMGGRDRGNQSDFLQDADASFWGEGRRASDATQVTIEADY